ncbi:hypothetical protein NIES4071_27660 [Calothrix sp. NIES-4071]|nr:hypothetical protein NIES4071_27660 [Calothrix sp. NIES-4071]BAZ57088.1 hypothetical protein NIES4105_27600 [Calothrix sp. NIES-4105]
MIKMASSDYTHDKDEILGNPTVDEIFSRIEKRRQQDEIGKGDYTRDRDEIVGNPTIEEVVAGIKRMRQEEKND